MLFEAHTPHSLPFPEAQRSGLVPWMVTIAVTYSPLLSPCQLQVPALLCSGHLIPFLLGRSLWKAIPGAHRNH